MKQAWLTLTLLLVSCCAHAQEPPFTLVVPLQLNNLPAEVTTYRVSCAVTGSPAVGMLGNNSVSGNIVGGAINTELRIPIALGPFADPNTAEEYSCSLHLSGTLDGRSVVFMSDTSTRLPLAPGAPANRRVVGRVPSS